MFACKAFKRKPYLEQNFIAMNNNTYDTLSLATNDLKKRGFDLDFNQKGHCLVCVQDNAITLNPDDFEIVEFHRFEGDSNPDDMSVVYAIESKTGQKGLMVDAYGVYAADYSREMLKKLDIRGR